ncbi:LCP family protein [Brevibacillus ginsengisoli]|uniref:LCP family protein n=1 Tax=Brevibacillus ginsengisoli TaxID=363854 RepID=UPI003CF475E4
MVDRQTRETQKELRAIIRQKRRRRRALLLRIFVIFLLAYMGYYVYAFASFSQEVQNPKIIPHRSSDPVIDQPKQDIPILGGSERVNILLMGVDRRALRPNEIPRSDSMMLVSIDPASKTFTYYSILRDTYIKIPGYGKSRINAAVADGGPELAMDTVSRFTGLPVSYYVLTDFEGFKGLVDAVGGVDMDVEKRMVYHDPTDEGKYDIDLQKGPQHLDGDKALQYVRFRHDATSDYTRTERQRKLLRALTQQLKSGSTILQMPHILQAVEPYVQTNLTSTDMVKLAALGLTLNSNSEGYQLPQAGAFHESNHGGSVLIPSVEDVQQYIQDTLKKNP